MVMKRSTSRFILAASTARPNRMKMSAIATYPGFSESAWSFCGAGVPVMLYRRPVRSSRAPVRSQIHPRDVTYLNGK